MENCNSTTTPCPKWRLTSSMSPSTDEERNAVASLPYSTLVSKCMYLAICTHPDISYAVRELTCYMSNYGQRHFDVAKHLLQYLQGTRSRGLIYGKTPNPYPLFRAFADSDWAMSEGRRSVSGFVIECAGAPIAWSSKQQAIVACLMRGRISIMHPLCPPNHLASCPTYRHRFPTNRCNNSLL